MKSNYPITHINLLTPVDGDCKNATPFVSTGQPETKGGYRKKHDFVNSIFAHYLGSSSKNQVRQLELSPKNQVRQLGGHMPYQGKRNVDLTINSELTGTYGRFGKSFIDYFQLIFFKENCNESEKRYKETWQRSR